MSRDLDRAFDAGDILCADDPDTPVDAWSLDELDRFADLDSVRAARSRTDDAGS